MTAPGRFGTIQSRPRLELAQALADGVLAALDDGDVGGARAAARALVAFVDALAGDSARELRSDVRGASGT